MKIFLILFFYLFSFSFQTIQAVFFCDDIIKAIYVLEESNEIKIEDEQDLNEEFIYGFNNLNAVPGDLIKLTCNSLGGWSFGAGCFVLNNDCHCYEFEIDKPRNYIDFVSKSYTFGNIICSMPNIYPLEEIDNIIDYDYKHYIPLDASRISCINNNNDVLTVQYGENHNLKLSDYISADFDIKNLKISIIENYDYFYLNDIKLEADYKFNISNNLIFKSENKNKIKIKFINYGIIFENNKECEFYIRVCHERCSDCYDKDVDENHHQCKACRNGFYFLENTNNCLKKQEMDWSKYYFNETEQRFKKCHKSCISNLEENLENSLINGDIDTSDIEKGKNEEVKLNDMTITFTTTESQKNDKNNVNKTTVDLGECENILRREYKIPENEAIIMIKKEVFQEGMKTPKIECDVLSRLNGTNLVKLNLSFCANEKMDISIPIQITENLDKLNSSSEYYTDLCYTATSDDGTDINLNDRKNEFVNNNITVCQEDCVFAEYDHNIKKAKCSCDIKESSSSFKDIKVDKSKLYDNFFDVKNIANINLLVCYKVLFSKKGMKNNYGSYFIMFIIILHFILIILFFAKGYFKKIYKKIQSIKSAINNWKSLLAERKRRKSEIKLEREKTIKEQKENQKQKHKRRDSFILPFYQKNKKDNNNPPIKKKTVSHNKSNKKSLKNILNNNRKEISQIDNNMNSKRKIVSVNKSDEKNFKKTEKTMLYNYDEINDLSYKEAKIKDNRTYCLYYLSLIKTNHQIMFTFFLNSDYNSKIIKIDLFIINFILYFSVNVLFFNDNTIHQIHEDKGSFNIEYQLPQIIYSTMISSVLNFILNLLALSQGLILKFKNDKTTKDLNNRVEFLKKNIKIKFAFYFVVSTIFLLFFWYYVSMFCAIYVNTQIHVIKDTLISYLFSLITPFFYYLIPGLFRIPALSARKKNRVCLYNISKILQML